MGLIYYLELNGEIVKVGYSSTIHKSYSRLKSYKRKSQTPFPVSSIKFLGCHPGTYKIESFIHNAMKNDLAYNREYFHKSKVIKSWIRKNTTKEYPLFIHELIEDYEREMFDKISNHFTYPSYDKTVTSGDQ